MTRLRRFLNQFGNADAEVVVDGYHLAARDEFVVDQQVDRTASRRSSSTMEPVPSLDVGNGHLHLPVPP